MWIQRDLLTNFDPKTCLEVLYVKGPRQIGKTSLLSYLLPKLKSSLFFDDLRIRELARKDPQFLLSQATFPLLIDEAHLAPEIFFAIKKVIDESRRERIKTGKASIDPAAFRLTGSNLTEINRSVRETLAGRASTLYLHGLSWNEVRNFDPKTSLHEYCFKGGFPELWVRKELSAIPFINDYISTFIEKDLGRTIGLEKRSEFLEVLGLLAARVGELLNYESLGNDANIAGKTVKQWVSLLEENKIVHILRPYSTNLNQRLIKMPKAYFFDLGICTRLQSHQEPATLFHSPQGGHLFECAVVSELLKAKDHFRKEWNLYFWRTKEGEEIDLILEDSERVILMEAKLGSTSHREIKIPKAFTKSKKVVRCIVVTASGETHRISKTTECIPLHDLVNALT
jgi:uncharacterized protein